MTIYSVLRQKVVVGILLLALLIGSFMVSVPQASAQASSEQAEVASLIAMIAQLQQQLQLLMQIRSLTSGGATDTTIDVGDQVRVTDVLSVRSAPGGARIGVADLGDTAGVIGGPVNQGGYTWWNLDYRSGLVGWSAANWLQVVPTQTSTTVNNTLPIIFSLPTGGTFTKGSPMAVRWSGIQWPSGLMLENVDTGVRTFWRDALSPNQTYTLTVPNNVSAGSYRIVGYKYGLNIEDEDVGVSAEFTITDANSISTGSDDLKLQASSADPDGSTLLLDEDDEVEHTIFAFDLSAEDSRNDIEISTIAIEVAIDSDDSTYDSFDEFVDEFTLELDGLEFDAESFNGSGDDVTLFFDVDEDVVVDEGEKVTAYLNVLFNDVDDDFEGATIEASVRATGIVAEGDEGDVVVGGAQQVSSEEHTLVLAAPIVDYVDDSAKQLVNSNTTADDNTGEFVIEFEVTAVGDDIYLPYGSYGNSPDSAFGYAVYDGNGDELGVSYLDIDTAYNSYDTTADRDTNGYRIYEGSTEQFVKTVVVDPVRAGQYKVVIDEIRYNFDGGSQPDYTANIEAADVESGYLFIDGTGVPRNGAGTGEPGSDEDPYLIVDYIDNDVRGIENDDTSVADDQGEYVLEFDVTAVDEDLFIPFGVSRGANSGAGFEIQILDARGAKVSHGDVTTSADADNARIEQQSSYLIDEGDTESFTLTVYFDPDTSGTYRVQLNRINFSERDSASGAYSTDLDNGEVDTDYLAIESDDIVLDDPVPIPAPTATINAAYGNTQSSNDKLVGPAGTTVSVWWKGTNATGCTVQSSSNQYTGPWTGTLNNTAVKIESVGTTYTVKCTGTDGSIVSDSVTLSPTVTTPTVTLDAAYGNTQSTDSQLVGPVGTTVSMWWKGTNVQSCTVTSNSTAYPGPWSGTHNNTAVKIESQNVLYTANCVTSSGVLVIDRLSLIGGSVLGASTSSEIQALYQQLLQLQATLDAMSN